MTAAELKGHSLVCLMLRARAKAGALVILREKFIARMNFSLYSRIYRGLSVCIAAII